MSDGGIESNIKEVQDKMERITPKLIQSVAMIIKAHSQVLASHVREEYMTGGTSDNKLAVKIGHLRASTKALPIVKVFDVNEAEQKEGTINGGIGIGPIAYATTHIGPKGQVMTIKPKKKKWLTIPLDAAKTKAGVTRGSALSGMWGETEFGGAVS